VTGYNAERDTVTFDDSLLGPDQRWSWDEFNARWGEFNTNRIFIPVYRAEQEPLVRAILGPDASDSQMWQRAEANDRAAIEAEPTNGLHWFALGDALLNQGRHAEALGAYEKAYGLGLPFRYYWYQFGHFEALAKAGRWQRLLELTDPVLETAPMHEEMYYYRGLALQNLGDTAGAREAYNAALANNGNMTRARAALQALR
ncbi:MAG: tetratricopeptide repeat protein, partial [Anaerolineae bacterium]|nr:tetratricopeptide repeat protein [Anaerolineae bacterium]